MNREEQDGRKRQLDGRQLDVELTRGRGHSPGLGRREEGADREEPGVPRTRADSFFQVARRN